MISVNTGTSARSRIREALVYNIKRIKKAAGYNNDISEIFTNRPSLDQMKLFPSVYISLENEKIELFERQTSTFKTIQKNMRVVLFIMLYDAVDMAVAQDKIIQDVEGVIGNHFGLPHPDGECTCFTSQVTDIVPFGDKATKPKGGVIITLNVRYQQLRQDPTQRA